MKNLLLVRYGEIFLKGLNRPYFIRALVRKVRYAVRGMGAEVWVHDGRIFVRGFNDLEECISRVTKVFGVHSVCPAVEMPKEDFEAICAQAVEMAKDLKGTFKVNARRADKRYPMNSMAINEEVGYRILQANPDLKVDVHNPEHLVNIEIRDMAYLYVKVIPDNLEHDSFMFKYGGLAKWHVKEEETDTSSHSPSYTESQRKIQVCEYGGESAKEDHPKARKGHAKRTRSLYERSTLAKCFERCCPKRTRLDEWVEGWSVHSGRFKLLT